MLLAHLGRLAGAYRVKLLVGLGDLTRETAIAMGSYDFTCATTGDISKVEYTFGYKRNSDGKVRIFLHHSSIPYTSTAGPAAVTEAEVLSVQQSWASAIKSISGIHKEGGDFIQAAGAAAGDGS